MLYKKAWSSWQRLSPSLKLWIDPEDIFQEAYMEALRCYERWEPKRATLSTFLFKSVDNHLCSLVAYWSAQKRLPTFQVPVEHVDRERVEEFSELIPDAVIRLVYEGWLQYEQAGTTATA